MSGRRDAYWIEDPWRLDIDAGYNKLPCPTEKCTGRLGEQDEHGQWRVYRIMDRLLPYERDLAFVTLELSIQLKTPAARKCLYALGDKYSSLIDHSVTLWLLVDSKEKYIMAFVEHLPYVLVVDLPVGDFWIVLSDGSFLHVLERKHVMDLLGSTYSRHKKSQIARMQQSGVPVRCMEWLIESFSTPAQLCMECMQRQGGVSRPGRLSPHQATVLSSSRRNLHVRDGFGVTDTSGLLGTVHYLLHYLQGVQLEGVYFTVTGMPAPLALSVADGPTQALQLLEWYTSKVTILCGVTQQQLSASRNIEAARKQAAGTGGKRSKDYGNDSRWAWGDSLQRVDGCTPAIAADIVTVYGSHRMYSDACRNIERLQRRRFGDKSGPDRKHHDSEEDAANHLDPHKEVSKSDGHLPRKRKRIVLEKDENTPQPSDLLLDDDDPDKTINKAQTEKKKKTQKKPKTSKKKQRAEADKDDYVLQCAKLLTSIQRTNGRPIGLALSGRIWCRFAARENDILTWRKHPLNPQIKSAQARLRKLQREQDSGKKEKTPTPDEEGDEKSAEE